MTLPTLLLMAVYTLLMGLLSLYAGHAFLMLYLHWRHAAAHDARPGPPPAAWPSITVQLPVFNERFVVERLIHAVAALDYPRAALEIQVLDDSTDETRGMIDTLVAAYQARGVDIRCLRRADRRGFKAGALRTGLSAARGEFVAVFDADFVPPPDFLKRLVPYFTAPDIALVQARWGHLNADGSPLTRSQAIGLDAHFVLEQGGRHAAGLFINFNGTAGVWRAAAIRAAGNWQDDTLTEDLDLSYRAQLAGWRCVYVNAVVCPAEVPAEIHGLKSQQYRWAKGAIQTARKLLPAVWRSRTLPALVKWEATIHLTNHLVFPALLLTALLIPPLLRLRAEHPECGWFFRGAALFSISALSYPLFYLVAQRALYPDWKRRVLFLPVLLAGALGMSVVNTRAVCSALLGRRSPFTRTPKFNLRGPARRSGCLAAYRPRFLGTVWLELGMGLYLTGALAVAAGHAQLLALPFIGLYWAGFVYVAVLSMLHAARS